VSAGLAIQLSVRRNLLQLSWRNENQWRRNRWLHGGGESGEKLPAVSEKRCHVAAAAAGRRSGVAAAKMAAASAINEATRHREKLAKMAAAWPHHQRGAAKYSAVAVAHPRNRRLSAASGVSVAAVIGISYLISNVK